jgi:hypothetical protein
LRSNGSTCAALQPGLDAAIRAKMDEMMDAMGKRPLADDGMAVQPRDTSKDS